MVDATLHITCITLWGGSSWGAHGNRNALSLKFERKERTNETTQNHRLNFLIKLRKPLRWQALPVALRPDSEIMQEEDV
eukprot:505572-Amphidinium_carterae.5